MVTSRRNSHSTTTSSNCWYKVLAASTANTNAPNPSWSSSLTAENIRVDIGIAVEAAINTSGDAFLSDDSRHPLVNVRFVDGHGSVSLMLSCQAAEMLADKLAESIANARDRIDEIDEQGEKSR